MRKIIKNAGMVVTNFVRTLLFAPILLTKVVIDTILLLILALVSALINDVESWKKAMNEALRKLKD